MKNLSKGGRYPIISKGEVYWFDPLEETQVGVSPLAVILSGEIHNKFSNYIVFNVAGNRNTETVRNFFEVVCEVEGKKIKVTASAIHMFNKEIFLQKSKYLGKLCQEEIKIINEKIKLILELDI